MSYLKCKFNTPWLIETGLRNLKAGTIYKTTQAWDAVYNPVRLDCFEELSKVEYLIELGKKTPVKILDL